MFSWLAFLAYKVLNFYFPSFASIMHHQTVMLQYIKSIISMNNWEGKANLNDVFNKDSKGVDESVRKNMNQKGAKDNHPTPAAVWYNWHQHSAHYHLRHIIQLYHTNSSLLNNEQIEYINIFRFLNTKIVIYLIPGTRIALNWRFASRTTTNKSYNLVLFWRLDGNTRKFVGETHN